MKSGTIIDIKSISAKDLEPLYLIVEARDEGNCAPIPWDADVSIDEDDHVILSGHIGPSGMGSCEVVCSREKADMLYVFRKED